MLHYCYYNYTYIYNIYGQNIKSSFLANIRIHIYVCKCKCQMWKLIFQSREKTTREYYEYRQMKTNATRLVQENIDLCGSMESCVNLTVGNYSIQHEIKPSVRF